MKLLVVGVSVVLVAAGCGGGSSEASEPLRTGVYEWELTEQYLLDNGVAAEQAANESGVQTLTLRDDGSFLASWRTAEGRTGSCRGTYEEGDDRRVTFRWTSGCFGDWAMTYRVEGDEVTWSDHEALPPYDSEAEQSVIEAFNSVPWTRVGDTPES